MNTRTVVFSPFLLSLSCSLSSLLRSTLAAYPSPSLSIAVGLSLSRPLPSQFGSEYMSQCRALYRDHRRINEQSLMFEGCSFLLSFSTSCPPFLHANSPLNTRLNSSLNLYARPSVCVRPSVRAGVGTMLSFFARPFRIAFN